MPTIDLNADLGEGYGPWKMGDDAAVMDIVTSANIACGGHAGDPATMFKSLVLAKENGVSVGAHPGFADREGFGRRRIALSPMEIEYLIASQVGAITGLAGLAGTKIEYVKPHGALANWAAEDNAAAVPIVNAVKTAYPDLAILAISGTRLEMAAKQAGVKVYSEVFADRGYCEDGTLVARSEPGALITDPDEASRRLLYFLETGKMPTVSGRDIALEAHSICIHGDSPHAVSMAVKIRAMLVENGVELRPFIK